MADPSHEPHDVNPLVHHEESDANTRVIVWIIFVSVVTSFLIWLIVTFLFNYLRDKERAKSDAPITLVTGARPTKPPEPRLQPFSGSPQADLMNTPAKDMKVFLAEEEKKLSTYGWVDREKGIVRIPIDAAIDKVLTQGLPSRNEAIPQVEASPAPEPAPLDATAAPAAPVAPGAGQTP